MAFLLFRSHLHSVFRKSAGRVEQSILLNYIPKFLDDFADE